MIGKNQRFVAASGGLAEASRVPPWLRLAALVTASLGLWWMVASLGRLIVQGG